MPACGVSPIASPSEPVHPEPGIPVPINLAELLEEVRQLRAAVSIYRYVISRLQQERAA